MLTIASILGLFGQQSPIPDAGSSGQQPAIIALVVGVCSAIGVLYSIYRQHTGDKSARDAAGRTVALEADKQSFQQLLEALKSAQSERDDVRDELRAVNDRLDELERSNRSLADHVARCEDENTSLRREVARLGGAA